MTKGEALRTQYAHYTALDVGSVLFFLVFSSLSLAVENGQRRRRKNVMAGMLVEKENWWMSAWFSTSAKSGMTLAVWRRGVSDAVNTERIHIQSHSGIPCVHRLLYLKRMHAGSPGSNDESGRRVSREDESLK